MDVKKTMSEVVHNIESRTSVADVKRIVDERVAKVDLNHLVQDKVSFDDLSQFIRNGELNGGNLGRQQTQLGGNQKSMELEQELGKLRSKLEETLNIVGRIQPPISAAELEERLSEKANKQSVAQALHRKVNKPDLETILAKKVDFEDLQRVLESKVDLVSF